MANDKQPTFGFIEGIAVYAKVAQADKKYESNEEEYSIGVIVDEDAADAWDEVYTKQPAKKFKAADFEGKFKIPLPEQFKGEKNVYQITLRKDTIINGEPIKPEHRPKVFLDENNGDRVDITESRLIANGSPVKVSYSISSNKFGTFARLRNVLVEEDTFVEYERKGGGPAGSEFGDKPIKKEAAKEEVVNGRPKKAKAEPKVEADDGDAPF